MIHALRFGNRYTYAYQLSRSGPSITLSYDTKTGTVSYADPENGIAVNSQNSYLGRKARRAFKQIEQLIRTQAFKFAQNREESARLEALKRELDESNKPDFRL